MISRGGKTLLYGVAASIFASTLPHAASRNSEHRPFPATSAAETSWKGSVFECRSQPRPNWVEADIETPEDQSNAEMVHYERKTFRYSETAYLDFRDDFMLTFRDGMVTLHPSGLSFECASFADFDKALVRFVQMLFRKADEGELSDDEAAQWDTLVSLFDYDRFRWDVAPSLYEEFTITGVNAAAQTVRLQRTDGKKFTCPMGLSPSFRNGRFCKNDRIGAFVKINYSGNIDRMSEERLLDSLDGTRHSIDEIQAI